MTKQFGFALLVSFLSFASTSMAKGPAFCFGYQNIQFVSLGSVTNDCDDFKYFDELGGAINTFLGYANPGSDIIAAERMHDAADSYTFDHLTISIKQNSPLDLQFINTIFIHEWSHALFNRYLQDNLSLFKDFLPLRAQGEELERKTLQVLTLVDENGTCSSSQCRQYFIDHQDDFVRQEENTKSINAFYNTNENVKFISAHYHELFADFVPALFYSNPEIAVEAGKHFFGEFSEAYACRSFFFVAPSGFKIFEPHCSLSTVRKQLGEKIQKTATVEEKQLLARQFLQLMANQVELQTQRTTGWTRGQLAQFPDEKALTDLRLAIDKLN